MRRRVTAQCGLPGTGSEIKSRTPGGSGDTTPFLSKRSNRAADTQLAHASLERGALHAQDDGGAFGSGDAPLRLLQGAEDVLAFRFFERGDRGGRGGQRRKRSKGGKGFGA